jgi:hypothetical protein
MEKLASVALMAIGLTFRRFQGLFEDGHLLLQFSFSLLL